MVAVFFAQPLGAIGRRTPYRSPVICPGLLHAQAFLEAIPEVAVSRICGLEKLAGCGGEFC